MSVEGRGEPVRLNLSRSSSPAAAAEWHDLAAGVRILLRPRSALLEAAVQTRIGQELAAFRAGAPTLAAYGFDPAEIDRLADPEIGAAYAAFLVAVVEASTYIADWNLVDGGGEPIPVSAAAIATLFREGLTPGTGWIMADAFNQLVEARNVAAAPVPMSGEA